MKSKRKIKGIKKYQYGGVDWQRQMTEQLLGVPNFSKYGPNAAQRASLGPTGNTSTPTNNINITDILGKGSDIIGGVTNIANMLAGPSTATTKGEAVQQSIQNVIGGAATGAQMGSVAGPVGAIVGGAAGLATGLVGKKGKISGGGFYEDPTLTLGTGIRGAIGNKGLKRRYEAAKTLAGQHRIGASIGAQAQQEWDEDYDQNVYTMESGGQIPSSMAYVDDGELINTPQGQILEVPEEGKPTDSNLVNLPEGSRVLSDTLKVPGSKETFAQMGKRLMSKQKTKGKDKYAENSAMLNEMNDQAIHDELFTIQEITKNKRSKVKNGIQAAADGDIITAANKGRYTKIADRLYRLWNYWEDVYDSTRYTPGKYNTTNAPTAVTNDLNLDNEIQSRVPDEQITTLRRNTPNFFTNASSLAARTLALDNLVNSGEWRGGVPYWLLSGSDYTTPINNTTTDNSVNMPNISVTPTKTRRSTSTTISRPNRKSIVEPINNEIDLSGEAISRVGDEVIPYETLVSAAVNNQNKKDNNNENPPKDKNNWRKILGDITSNISQIAPIFSNLMTSPENFEAVYNPYADNIIRTMSGRKFDIAPAKRAIRENRAISNYNASQYNPTTGANLAYRLQSQIAADKAISDLYSQKNNIDNQYKSGYANTLNNLGRQFVGSRNLSIDQNARSRDSSRNINKAGLSQLSNYFQNKGLMRNQRNRDIAMLEAYAPFLETTYKSGDYINLMKQFRRG